MRNLKWILLILAGLVIGALSCFDTGVTDPDDTRLTQETCADNPVPGCVNAEDIVDPDRDIDHPWAFALGAALVLIGIGGIVYPSWKHRSKESSPFGNNKVCVNCSALNSADATACIKCGSPLR